MRRVREHLQVGWRHFWRQVGTVLRRPVFLVLTVVGNTLFLTCAASFHALERSGNPRIHSFADSLWWALTTMTTVGYGDIVPMTGGGRAVAALLMLTGGVLFFSFVAILGGAFVELEFLELVREVRELREEVRKLTPEKGGITDRADDTRQSN